LARKILLADDSVTAQNMGRKILADAGYEVITVNNGSAALKKIAEHRPDLIVLDVYMPGYSGLEVCQRLKEVAETARIPVLLTVGKLEPFKTDEAKRVRADGFIVKPFEASELLSALSKLEDKIVPRAEGSKPGRLARANAAIEEGRDKAVTADEDSGWKNRISFPSKKKEAPAENNPDDTAMYNPVNKDLRTTIDHHRASEKPKDKDKSEDRVDLGALAPEGLPKDVTPEEIAALAAAAAQVQGKILESKAAQALEQVTPSAPVESHTENPETKPEAPPAEAVAPATFAEQAPQEKIEAPPALADASAPASVATEDAHSGNGSSPHGIIAEPSDGPVTMAVANGSESANVASHWSGVAVALAPEDEGISLEQEMQQAYAAFAAAESGHSAPITTNSANESIDAALASTSAEGPVPEAVQPIPATIAPEAAQALTEVASAATEAVSAAVKEFENVAASYVPESASASADSSPSQAPESVSEPPETIETSTQQAAVVAVEGAGPQAETTEALLPQPTPEELPAEESKHEIAVTAIETAPAIEVPTDGTAHEQVSSDPAPAAAIESTAKSGHNGDKKESDIAATTAAAWASWRRIRESGTPNSDPQAGTPQTEKISSDSHDAAAMAVAAGAENAPEEAAAYDDSDPAIASIVDSVLADLRPKIVEEISRKLGKKK
jgi:two-component system chemotaxis response regulator CheY